MIGHSVPPNRLAIPVLQRPYTIIIILAAKRDNIDLCAYSNVSQTFCNRGHFIRGRRTSGQPRRITHTKKCRQVSRKNTIPVAEVTTATFCVYTNLKSFLQLRLKNKKLRKELIRLLSVGQPMRAVSALMYGRFFISSVSNLILAKLPPATTWRIAAEHRWSEDHSLRNTSILVQNAFEMVLKISTKQTPTGESVCLFFGSLEP
jgi:hypothetical protein